MNWIYLSPHPDDAALSCGGLIARQTSAGIPVQIWTICAGEPPEAPLSSFAEQLHARWETGPAAITRRRAEDRDSAEVLGAAIRHFPIPDCIYRRSPLDGKALYDSEESLTGPLHPDESILVESLAATLSETLPPLSAPVCPMALGGHVDHRLVRAAAEALRRPLWYYPDYPYVVRYPQDLEALRKAGWLGVRYPIGPADLSRWQASVAAHRSQISTFWPNLAAMQADLTGFRNQMGGVRLWRPALT